MDSALAASVVIRPTTRHSSGAIASALRQTMADLECIVVDDGSTDSTPALLASIKDRAAGHPRPPRRRGRRAQSRRRPRAAPWWRSSTPTTCGVHKLTHERPSSTAIRNSTAVFSDLEKEMVAASTRLHSARRPSSLGLLGEREYRDGWPEPREVFLVLLEEGRSSRRP